MTFNWLHYQYDNKLYLNKSILAFPKFKTTHVNIKLCIDVYDHAR